MSPLRQSARVARGLSIEPSNIDSGEPPTSAEPRASPDRENCPLSEPLSSLPASGWSIWWTLVMTGVALMYCGGATTIGARCGARQRPRHALPRRILTACAIVAQPP